MIASIAFVVAFSRINLISVTLWSTGFLCLLNIGLAILYRRRQRWELLSYYAACGVELLIFVFAFGLALGLIAHVPYPLPPGLPFDRAEIGATIALSIGLFPATYWHRTSLPELSARMAQDAKMMKDRNGGVRMRKNAPGEWMN